LAADFRLPDTAALWQKAKDIRFKAQIFSILTTEQHGKQKGMDSILKKPLDRINRMYKIFVDRFPASCP
jgi:hypothetical protein